MSQVILKKKKNLKPKIPIFKVEFSNEIYEIPFEENTINNKSKNKIYNYFTPKKYFLQFIFSIIIGSIFILILLYQIYNLNRNEKVSKKLLNNYSLVSLYEDSNPIEIENKSPVFENPFVIGIIKIARINLNYPIISETNSDLLKISVCRFVGPMPNEYGNLCIAGHNYVDNKFFSNLPELEKDDLIEIYDLNGKKINYLVFDKYEVKSDDLSCTSQNVTDKRIITLLTCNNMNGKRIVVKAIESI